MDAIKVTDPAKTATDTVLLAHLARQGVDKDYVELASDYDQAVKGQTSPYAKFYRDRQSDKQFAVISQLPMVDHAGKTVEVGWQKTSDGYTSKNNLFQADVKGLELTLTVRGDQPDGRKRGQQATARPQLFLNDVEQKPVSENAALLSVDPLNENYNDNTLEWDYGVCKRRLRVIEGRLLGAWEFTANPGGDVKIVYNQQSGFKLKLGYYAVNDDTEFISAAAFSEADYPLTVSDSATFYPDADPETSTVDGYPYHTQATDWATLKAGAGSAADDSSTSAWAALRTTTSPNFYRIYRAIFLFSVSLPTGAVISAATFSVYKKSSVDDNNCAPTLNVYASNPASNTALVASDFTSLGSTKLCNTDITYAGFAAGYNDFVLNATGLAAIPVSGIAKLGLRESTYDGGSSTPTWYAASVTSGFNPYTAEQGSGYKPKLVIEYYVVEAKTSGDSGGGTETTPARNIGVTQTGAGTEASARTAALTRSDSGSGTEVGGLLKGLNCQDTGGGADKVRLLAEKAGFDLKLPAHQGRVDISHKEVKI
jgi:hypothetical protein